jgi:hypothetical protein
VVAVGRPASGSMADSEAHARTGSPGVAEGRPSRRPSALRACGRFASVGIPARCEKMRGGVVHHHGG